MAFDVEKRTGLAFPVFKIDNLVGLCLLFRPIPEVAFFSGQALHPDLRQWTLFDQFKVLNDIMGVAGAVCSSLGVGGSAFKQLIRFLPVVQPHA